MKTVRKHTILHHFFHTTRRKVYYCGKPNHKSPDFRKRNENPREEWVINKSQFHTQTKIEDNTSKESDISTKENNNNPSNNEENHVGWIGINHSFVQEMNLSDMILLDSNSTDIIFVNPKYVMSIREEEKYLELNTNGGYMLSTK